LFEVAPVGVAPGAEQVEHALALLGRFVHGLDGLKGQRHMHGGDAPAVLIVLAFPDQFSHTQSSTLAVVSDWPKSRGDFYCIALPV